jgi:hypothetical protein
MTDTEAVRELKVNVRLLFDGKEVQTVEKSFAIQNVEEKTEGETDESKTIDETITKFLDGLQKTASENGYVISKEAVMQTTIALILYLVKQDTEEKTIEVQLIRPEVKENGDNANSS